MNITIPRPELVDIDELTTDGDNPNRMTERQHESLKRSIEKYGFIIPIITNKDLLIADGEQRLTVARDLGMKQVRVVRLPVEDVDRRLLRQVLNKLKGEHELVLDSYEFERILKQGGEDELKTLINLNDEQLYAMRFIRESGEFDPYKEWVGMPEYENEDLPDRSIIVHFKAEEDVQEFAKRVEQSITDKTRYIWFPYQPYERTSHLRYKSEP